MAGAPERRLEEVLQTLCSAGPLSRTFRSICANNSLSCPLDVQLTAIGELRHVPRGRAVCLSNNAAAAAQFVFTNPRSLAFCSGFSSIGCKVELRK